MDYRFCSGSGFSSKVQDILFGLPACRFMRYGAIFIVYISLLVIVTSCIFGRSTITPMSYRNGKVFLTNKAYYFVSEPQAGWRKIAVQRGVIMFYNDNYGAAIATTAFCGKGYDDAPLRLLSRKLLEPVTFGRARGKGSTLECGGNLDGGIRDRTEDMNLDGVPAVRHITSRNINDVCLVLDTVTLKKRGCNIDFILASPASSYKKVAWDFVRFYTGFRY